MLDRTIPRVLTIAGSDSGGGAGIQADLKTFTALGVYGMAAITSVTAQNTQGVFGVVDLPPEFVSQQIDLCADDIGIDAAKTGMLSNADIVTAVSISVTRSGIRKLVVDPVMVAKSGDPLLKANARLALKEKLLPLAYLVTPNIPEAASLADMDIRGESDIREAAERIYEMGPRYVLMKGGHLEGAEATDYLFDGVQLTPFTAPRIDTKNTHGTGCTYSAALASFLAKGLDIADAVREAKHYLTKAIQRSLPLGQGHGPLNHMWGLRDSKRE
jgi:hydroxymethylpyrimidine/phosphomethylpyrimidine kinase